MCRQNGHSKIRFKPIRTPGEHCDRQLLILKNYKLKIFNQGYFKTHMSKVMVTLFEDPVKIGARENIERGSCEQSFFLRR